jgi:hypothetical protein
MREIREDADGVGVGAQLVDPGEDSGIEVVPEADFVLDHFVDESVVELGGSVRGDASPVFLRRHPAVVGEAVGPDSAQKFVDWEIALGRGARDFFVGNRETDYVSKVKDNGTDRH